MKPVFQFIALSLAFGPLVLRSAEKIVGEGEHVTISYGLGAGTPPFTHQWFKDGKPIPGATGATLVIPAAKVEDVGSYRVRVANKSGETISDIAAISIIVKPAQVVTKIASETATVEALK